jgi:glycosyltransferase involved in cell wall biosynthesis
LKACVVQDFRRTADGLQKNSLVVIETLKELGYEVNLCTLRTADMEGASHNFNTDLKSLVSGISTPRFMLRNNKLNLLRSMIKHISPREDADICINMMANWFPFVRPKDPSKLIMYVGAFPKIPLQVDDKASIMRKTYCRILNSMMNRKLGKLLRSATVVTPSASLRKVLSDVWHIDAKILYPPIDFVAFQASLEDIERKETDTIALSGRMHSFKRFESGISVAERIPGSVVQLIAASDSQPYLETISNKIKVSHARDRIKLQLDKPLHDRVVMLKRSKVFLHAAIGEGFGGVIAEAMAAGCIPVVHDSGGPSEFVPKKWRYSSFEECIEKVNEALAACPEEHMQMVGLAEHFSTDHYKQSLSEIIESLLKFVLPVPMPVNQ